MVAKSSESLEVLDRGWLLQLVGVAVIVTVTVWTTGEHCGNGVTTGCTVVASIVGSLGCKTNIMVNVTLSN